MNWKSQIHQARTVSKAVRACSQRSAFGAVGAALAFWFFVLASQASAAPIHTPLPEFDLVGAATPAGEFNKACGTAVDSEGDLYVANAGNPSNSAINAFKPTGDPEEPWEYLTSIENASKPCGLAVDSNGTLYVSESATENVIRCVPGVYPPEAGTEYACDSTPISGEAKGISVDPFDSRLYAAKGNRIDVYKPDGAFEESIGEGDLSEAVGAAAYTYPDDSGPNRYVFVADDATDEVFVFRAIAGNTPILRYKIDGSGADIPADEFDLTFDETPNGNIGFGIAGANLAVDQASGHFFVYDQNHLVVDEFEATGQYFTQISGPDFSDAEPTAIAVFPQRNEVQRLKVGATGGQFTLTFEGETTDPIGVAPFEEKPTSAEIEIALESLSAIGPGNVAVHGRYNLAFQSGSYSIAFVGALAHIDVDQIVADGSELTGGSASASVTTEVQGSGPGRLHVTAGSGPGAKVLAFAPLEAASRPLRPDLSLKLTNNTCAVAVDRFGNRYVAADSTIGVYPPDSDTPLTTISDPGRPCDLEVDSVGNLYALNRETSLSGDEKAVYYKPDSFPPTVGTVYSGPIEVATADDFPSATTLTSIGINPVSDHVFVTQTSNTIELGSAKEGSPILDPDFAAGLVPGDRRDIAAYGANGNVYIGGSSGVVVVDRGGAGVLGRVRGTGSPKGPLSPSLSIAVDQANGHVVIYNFRGVAEEYEASGAFVTEFGSFTEVNDFVALAVDNSSGLNDRTVYVAFDDTAPETFDLTAFGPLAYGVPPLASTGIASSVAGGEATLNGTVDPRGLKPEDCHFEYLTDAEYQQNIEEAEAEGHEEAADEGYGFEGAASEECAESLDEIGSGIGAVPVHANVDGLDPEGRYRFRLVAENKFGTSEGDAGLFGPPVLTPAPARPVFYTEATLRATIDPAGLATKFHFDYVTQEHFEADGFEHPTSTAEAEIPAGREPTDIEVPLFDLAEEVTYHFRIVVGNEVKTLKGPDQTLTTLGRPIKSVCPNEEFRIGPSANLPDCRAYELTTPADTRGATPFTVTSQFNNWLVTPRGEGAGERLSFFTGGTLPGFGGSGRLDGYRSQRAVGEGPHPSMGWTTDLVSPSYIQLGGSQPGVEDFGLAPDQRYSFWEVFELREVFEGSLAKGRYLRTPTGFDPIGRGSLGSDLDAKGRFVAAGATHVIFSSKAHLESEAPPVGVEALYDRTPSGTQVVSVPPTGASEAEAEKFKTLKATYAGATEDGSTAMFTVDGALYARPDGEETVKVANDPNTFAGVSETGDRVFYADESWPELNPSPAGLHVLDLDTQTATAIASDAIFVNVAADGSHVYFTSQQQLGDAPPTLEFSDKLYLWDYATETTRFIGVLDPQDLISFEGQAQVDLLRWTGAIVNRRAESPTRSTADGGVLVFLSHAQLTSYDNTEATAAACGDPKVNGDRCAEIYRYNSKAVAGEQLLCVSCDPSGAPASADAALQTVASDSRVDASTLIPNLTEDGLRVFFESEDALLPEDANSIKDIYEWKAQGVDACKRLGGCLALISSGQGEHPNYLYSMTPDGHDVFFRTLEKLHGADVTGSPSIYDARVEGGIPDPPQAAPCQGDACQGQGSTSPNLPNPTSTGSGPGNFRPKPSPRCPKGKRRVRRSGKVICVKRHGKKQQKKRGPHKRRAER